MPRQKNTDNSRATNSTAKCNFNAIQYGNDHGRIAFGKVHKKADVTSSVMLEAKDGRHKFSMDHDGQRKGWTTLTSPGSIQMKCGHDLEEEEDGFFLESINGDIDIIATNGKIRLQANDIELVAVGEDTAEGNIKMTASENISGEAKKIIMNSKNNTKMMSSGITEAIGNAGLNLYGNIISGVSDAVAVKDSKVGGQRYQQQQNQV